MPSRVARDRFTFELAGDRMAGRAETHMLVKPDGVFVALQHEQGCALLGDMGQAH